MTIDLEALGLGDLPDGLIDVAAELAGDGAELARRWTRVAEMRAAGVETTDPHAYRQAVEDAEVYAALTLQRAELRIRQVVAGLADDVLQVLAKLVIAAVASAI